MKPVPLPPSRWMFDPREWPRDDCIAGGADLAPETIIDAYRAGAFPMPHRRQVMWWSPLERGVLGPGDIRISRSLRRSMRDFGFTIDRSFEEVVDACADPSRPGGWITRSIKAAYLRLYDLGYAHSIETRDRQGRLVGGLYGLSIGSLFAGESMFHRAPDASKAALVRLVEQLSDLPDWLVDTQWCTPHLASLGVRAIGRDEYLGGLGRLVDGPEVDWDSNLTTRRGTPDGVVTARSLD